MHDVATCRPPARSTFRLTVYAGQSTQVFPLAPDTTVTIGRSADNQIRVDDPLVSRCHAALYVSDDGVAVEDTDSANGTEIVRVATDDVEETTQSNLRGRLTPRKRAKLGPGDALRIGSARLVLDRVGEQPEWTGLSGVTDDAWVVRDPEMRKTYALAERAAASDITVLILGETGVGKELMAEAVYRNSRRSKCAFLKLNCAALPESLLEGELFGHERGSYTGAHAAKAGLIEATDGGTVFLDEIGELPLTIQAKLLRVLEERTVMRIGSNKSKPVNVRFITATNRSLTSEVRAGRFRADLYYRINGLQLEIPPLRQRKAEIEPLATHFLHSFCVRTRLPIPTITDDAWSALQEYSWPGNVRELRNVIERAALLAGNSVVTRETIHLGPEDDDSDATLVTDDMLVDAPRTVRGRFPMPSGGLGPDLEELPSSRRQTLRNPPTEIDREGEKLRILRALEACGGNQTRAAKLLNVSRRTLINRLEEFQLPRPKKG